MQRRVFGMSLAGGLLALGLAGGLPAPAGADSLGLPVTVTYRERMALPPDAVVEIELLDVSRADAPSERLSSQRFAIASVPFSATLSYDPALIDDRLTLTVAARILSDGAVLFRSTTINPVLTRGAPDSAQVVLTRAMETVAPASAPGLAGVTWVAVEIAGQPVGDDNPPTLEFQQNGQFALYAGCNRFAGRAEVNGADLTIPQNFAGTLMACPKAREALEKSVLGALAQTSGFVRAGDTLTLTDTAGATVARFRAGP